jgi:hypothetical protein
MIQVGRNATLEDLGYLQSCRHVLQDRDAKFCAEFWQALAAGGVKCLRPGLNAGGLHTRQLRRRQRQIHQAGRVHRSPGATEVRAVVPLQSRAVV